MQHMQHKWRDVCLYMLILSVSGGVYADRSVEVLTLGWRFTRGEQRRIATRPEYDDSAWQTVRVPHDWAIGGPFDEGVNGYA
jgi:beta-galactosidase